MISNLLGLVLADDELIQAPADLLGRREARPRRGRPSGVGVGRGRRQGEGAGTGREEAARRGEHDARGRRGWDQSPEATASTYSPISRRELRLSLRVFNYPVRFICSNREILIFLFRPPGLFREIRQRSASSFCAQQA